MSAPCLSKIVAAVLALTAGGCCPGLEDEPWTVNVMDVLSGSLLDEIRESSTDPDMRCRTACVRLAELDGERSFAEDEVTSCEAVPVNMNPGDPEDAPWNPVYTELTITCTAEGVDVPFCTGRRPLGHREAALPVAGVGAWFAVHAHLERASITAFEQLAAWLHERDAPTELVERCLSARTDEIDHARRMTEQAQRCGVEVPGVELEPAGDDELLAVAVHNAVEGCVSEAFAAVLAAYQARHVDDVELRELFSVLAADELRHGQLAWDIHAWLHPRLSPSERAWVDRSLASALARLPQIARQGAEATPSGLGWPPPELAQSMARSFAARVESALAAA